MRDIVLIVHDIRSCHNVGSLLRTAEGLGVQKVYLTGYTPYPLTTHDDRLPHISSKLTKQIHKTALGAETLVPWEHRSDIARLIRELQQAGYRLVGLEQTPQSIALSAYQPLSKIVVLLGREVEGIAQDIMDQLDDIVEIPMYGKKESFNVVQAAAMMLYHLQNTQ